VKIRKAEDMKKFIAIFLIFIIGCSSQPIIEGLIDWECDSTERVRQLVNAMVIGEYASVQANFNAATKKEFSVKALREMWEGMINETGAFIAIYELEELPSEDVDIYIITTQHEERNMIIRVVFDSHNKMITHFHLRFPDIVY
jgi:hypothetical protein